MRKSTAELEQELARIPPEYQEVFRETLNRELKEAGQDLTDQDILVYLRRRMEDLRRGDFIRPDGKTGTTTLETTEMWNPAVVSEIAQDVEGKPAARQRERRRTVIKGGALLLVAVIFVLVVANGRRQRTAQAAAPEATAEGTATSPTEVSAVGNPLLPTPTLIAPTGADDTLQTIGGLGGSLTLGRPSALEIRYMATEETVALPIDPARVSNKGEMPYNPVVMASDSPVAVWVFGTVLNYAIGLPENLVTALQPGDRLRVTTDTGFALPFIVTQTERRASHEAGDLLSQNRVGMTLFALPARSADAEAVPVALAAYDLTGEDAQTAVYRAVGDPFFPGGDLKLTAVSFSDTPSGELEITLSGTGQGNGLLSLQARSHQTTAVPLPAADPWQLTFLLPGTVADMARGVGEPLTAVYRQLPGGESAFIRLGDAPNLLAQLEVGEPRASWQAATGEMVVTVTVTNPGPGLVRLPGDYMQIPNKGGDAYESGRLMDHLLEAGETYQVRLAFPHAGPTAPFVVQIGQWLWGAGREVSNDP